MKLLFVSAEQNLDCYFSNEVKSLKKVGALQVVRNREDIVRAVSSLLEDENLRLSKGKEAERVVKEKSGALEKTFDLLLS